MTRSCFVVGQYHGQFLRDMSDRHAMLVGATRTGKDVSGVLPTLYMCPGSVVVHDIKGEDWYYTAGWRQWPRTYCLYLNPTDLRSIRHNPLFEVRKGLNEIRDVQNVSDMLVDPEGSRVRKDHWEKTSHTGLTGVALHVLYAEPNKTLTGMVEFMSDPRRSFYQTLDIMMRTLHLGDRPHPVIEQIARELLNKGRDELSSVLSTMMSFLGLYRDPLIARTTSTSDFTIADLQEADRPVSLYLVTPPSDLSRTRAYMRLFLNQMGRRLTERFVEMPPATQGLLPQPQRYPLAMILNEFASLGHLEFLESEVAYLAGYNIRVMFVLQSLHQLDRYYSEHNSLLDNAHLRCFYGTNDDRMAKRLADFLNRATVTHTQHSLSGSRFGLWYTQRSQTIVESGRDLLTPGEIMELSPEHLIIRPGGQRPILAEKLRYYADPRFMAMVQPPPDMTALPLPPVRPNPWQIEGPKRLRPQSRQEAKHLATTRPLLAPQGGTHGIP